jgi:murein DD-endopeptidase MepM/ murein hydrolase activator NlpD
MLKKYRLIVFLFIIFPFYSYSQSENYFRSPLNIKLNLAGDFGEIRANHFHSGIDIKTNQRVGYPVFAVADGFVSRLRVQELGFGNAIYIDHPNGFTSVYAHLSKYNAILARFVKDYQYKNKTFEVDFKLTPIEIPIKKGDIIGYTGNTGSSVAPHLHFEIRNTKTEEIINPLSFGFDIPDNIKP